MRVSIVGAGLIGIELARQLVARGHIPTLLSRTTSGISASCPLIKTDVLDAETPLPLPRQTDAVFYLAQSPWYHDFPQKAGHLFGVNSWGPVRAAEAASRCGCRFFFYASTGSVYAPSFSPLREDSPLRQGDAYAQSKLAAETMLRLFSSYFTVCIGRLFTVYGPGQSKMLPHTLSERIRTNSPVILAPRADREDGGLRISFIYNPDLAICLVLLAELALAGIPVPTTLNIAGPEGISLKDYAERIGEALGLTPRFSAAPKPREGDLIADISKLRRIFPLPFTPLEEGIAATFRKGSAG